MGDGEKETITISSCPVCSEGHEYSVIVTRSTSIGLISLDFGQSKQQPRKKRVTRLFTCPTRNENFQVTLTFLEYPSSPINSIEVEK